MTDMQPIFQKVFGADWDALPSVFHRHYGLAPYTEESRTVEGKLDIFCTRPVTWIGWILNALKSIPPVTVKDVPVTVTFRSDRQKPRLYFERVFHLQGRPPYRFKSYMLRLDNNDVIEVSPGRNAWRMRFQWRDNKVVMSHVAFGLYLFGRFIPFGQEWLLGEAYAEEYATGADSFGMMMHLTHLRWGSIYEYKGHFRFA